MAAEIPNLVKRNGIYYFRCRIPSILTNGRAREVKISLKTGNLTSDLLDVMLKVTDYSRRVIAESLKTHNQGGANDMNIVTEIRNRITQYIETSLIDQDIDWQHPFAGHRDGTVHQHTWHRGKRSLEHSPLTKSEISKFKKQ